VSDSDAPDVTAAPPLPPLWKRIVDAFVEPTRLGDALAARPVWVTALLVGVALVVASSLLIPADVWQDMMRTQMSAGGREVPEGMAGVSTTVFRVWAVVGGLIFWPVWTFLVAGVVTLVFAFILGDEGRYRQYLALTSHALLIAAIGGLLVTPLRIAQSDPQLTLSVGTFLGLEGGYLQRYLAGLDLFMLWAYVVLGIGVSRVDRSRSPGSAVAILMVFVLAVTALFALIPRPA
jgi:hypothetical protein